MICPAIHLHLNLYEMPRRSHCLCGGWGGCQWAVSVTDAWIKKFVVYTSIEKSMWKTPNASIFWGVPMRWFPWSLVGNLLGTHRNKTPRWPWLRPSDPAIVGGLLGKISRKRPTNMLLFHEIWGMRGRSQDFTPKKLGNHVARGSQKDRIRLIYPSTHLCCLFIHLRCWTTYISPIRIWVGSQPPTLLNCIHIYTYIYIYIYSLPVHIYPCATSIGFFEVSPSKYLALLSILPANHYIVYT